MEATLSFAPGRSTLALGADTLSAYSLPSPGLTQDTPRYAGDRLSPATINFSDNLSSSSSQRSYSNGSNYFAQVEQPSQQHRQFSPDDGNTPWSGSRQPSTTPTSVSIPDIASGQQQQQHQQQQQSAPQQSQAASLDQQHQIGQMSVSLNHHVSLGGQAGLGHGSLANSPSFGQSSLGRSFSNETTEAHQHQHQQHHWNPSRSLFTAPSESYRSSRNTPSPTSHTHNEQHQFTQQDASATNSHFQSTMSGHTGGIGGDGLRRSPNLQQQHHQPQDQHGQRQDFSTAPHRGPLLSSGHGLSSQPRTPYDASSAASNSNTRDSTGAGGYRGHPSPTPGLGMTGFSSKLGGGIHHPIPNQSSFQVYNTQPMHHPAESHYQHQPQQQQQQQQQHGLPSPTHAGNPMRLIPPPLPSQASMSGMIPSPLGSSGSGRGYSPYGHPGSAPPHSPGLGGPVMSNSGGQMTLMSNMGMPYNSGGGSPGGGVGGPGSSYMGRGRPLLYSHNSLHTHHLNPHQIGHHHLPGILGGKSHHGPGGPTAVHERPFKCDQCPQSFNRNHDLKRHKRIHLAVKPFPCNYCEKSFSRKDALKRHRLVKGCGERPSDNSGNNMSSASGIHPPSGSVLSDSTSDGGHDGHGLLR